MRDAIVMPVGFGITAIVTAALAATPHPPAVEPVPVLELASDPEPIAVTERGHQTDTDRALALATRDFGDDHNPFEVFSTATLGDQRAVFVRRQTGGCGGCGALTVAVIFRGDQVVIGELGEFGRFGNGPDAVRLFDVVGHPVIEVDETLSMGGFTETFRELFVVDQTIDWQICMKIGGSDSGARERGSEWRAKVWTANDGTMYFVPDYTKRGEVTPTLYAFSFLFDHGHWDRPTDQGRCIDPQAAEELD